MQRFDGKIRKHALKFTERLRRVVEYLGFFDALAGIGVRYVIVATPMPAFQVKVIRGVISGKNNIQVFPVRIAAVADDGFTQVFRDRHNILHQLVRVLKDSGVDLL